jgi:Tol biopolymer transport system component
VAHTNSHSATGKSFVQIAGLFDGQRRQVAERQQPSNFDILGPVIAWAPDGRTLAAVVSHHSPDAHYSSIVGIDVANGSERALSSGQWYNVSGLQWRSDGTGLLLTASDDPAALPQIWWLPLSSGERGREKQRKLTNDLSGYSWLSVASDAETMVSVQTHAASSLWSGDTGQSSSELFSENGPLNPVVWLPDGTVVFRSYADGSSNLWVMNAQGGERRQVTTDAQVSERGMCGSPDGRHIVFVSWRGQKQHLWRVDMGDGRLTQLTSGDGEAYPSCSPDGRWVVYQQGLGIGKPTVARVALTGGAAQPLIRTFATKPVVSNDGARVAYFYMDEDRWRIAIAAASSGATLQTLDVPEGVTERVMRWAPDDRALLYVATAGDIGNVWTLPLDGGHPTPVTRFTSHLMNDFTFSADGKQVVFARTSARRDAVLLRRTNPPAP